MSEEDNDARSEESSSSEEEEYIEETTDKDFFKTLSYLKNKDPKIYDKDAQFYTEKRNVELNGESSKSKSENPVYLRDYERETILRKMNGVVEEEDESIPIVKRQEALKRKFHEALADSSDEDDLLKVKEKSKAEKETEEEDYLVWLNGQKEEIKDHETQSELKPLHEFWNNPSLDKDEQFLKTYILNKAYLDEDESHPNLDEDLLEDEEHLEKQAEFETAYNFRFETANEDKDVKRYPRGVIEGSARRKNDARKLKRQKIRERKNLEKEKKRKEITKNQKEKLEEMKEKIEEIKRLTNNPELGFKDDEILDDFDPEEHDKKMNQIYNEEFYNQDDGERPEFDDEIEGDDDMYVEEEEEVVEPKKKETRSKKKRKGKKKAFTEIESIPKPIYDPAVHETYQNYMDEYYKLDCEDFIDDIPCRFKYRQVVANDYGLSVEEILAADDTELNKWVSSKKILKLRPDHVEKNEVKIYKQKGQDMTLKSTILRSIYGNPEEADEQQQIEASTSNDDSTKKHRKFKPKKQVAEEVSDSRLLAYEIKPRKFRNKLKYKKT